MKTDLNRRRWLYGGVAAVAAGAGVGGAWMKHDANAANAGGNVNASDPTFWSRSFVRPEGGELKLADFRGKPLLVNFWATWCPPCRKAIPSLKLVYDRFKAQGLVLAISEEEPNALRKFVAGMT